MKRFFLIACSVALLDQVSKILALRFFANLVSSNQGTIFGLLSDRRISSAVWIAVSLAVVVVLVILLQHTDSMAVKQMFGLITGGILGNLFDRILRSGVLDFIRISVGPYQWPSFNLADVAITVGITVVIVRGLKIKNGNS